MIKQGFVMLYAVILVSIVLTVSLSLFDISYRQIVLSSTVESSQKSFYVANGVRDCIRYWNSLAVSPSNYFGKINTLPSDITPPDNPFNPELDCAADATISAPNTTQEDAVNVVSEYDFNYSSENVTVKVIVTKRVGQPGPRTTVNEFDVEATFGVGTPRQVQTKIRSIYQ